MSASKVCVGRYSYNALDLLTAIEPAGQQTLQRFYCGDLLATELQGAGSQSVLQQGNQLLALQTRNSGGINNRLLTADQQRSVLQVADPDGSVQHVYSPYGHRRVASGPGSLLGFNGEAVDPLTGHYLLGNGHRLFSPVLMRFNRPDGLSPFGRGGLNPYAYCGGDPVNYVDPTGQFFTAVISRIITAAGSLFNSVVTLKPGIPFQLSWDALAEGAVFRLPPRATVGVISSVTAGVTGVLGSGVGLAATVVAAINPTSSLLTPLAHTSLGLMGGSALGRAGSYWAARSQSALAAIKRLAQGLPVVSTRPSTIGRAPTLVLPHEGFTPSAPPLSPFGASAPPLTPGPGTSGAIKRRADGLPVLNARKRIRTS